MNKKKFVVAMLACVMCMSTGAALAACTPNDDTPPTGQEQTEPEKVKDGEAFGLEVGGEPRYITVRDYITLNGNTPTCSSSDKGKVVVSYDGGVVTVTPVAEGGATVTITCRSVTVTFEVTVNPLPAAKFTVTVDGKTVANLEAGSEYELPAATEATVPEDFEFLGWTVNGEDKQPGYKITVTDNVDIISNIQRKAPEKVKDGGDVAFNANGTHRITVSEYITTHGNDVTVTSSEEKITASHSDGVVTLTATEACGGTVTVACGEINITFNVTVSEDQDLSVYMLKNGGFDDGLEGWTMDGEVGEISTESTFWEQNYPVYNDGNYFAGNESGTGTVTSSAFKVGGINKITFRMGAAGNPECYITLEDEDGTVLAIWRNTKFKDETDWVKEEIGVTQFGNNLATYVADLAAHAGKTVKIVLHDSATSGFGFINLDDVVTYYASEEELPEGAFEAVNQLTVDKTALKATLDGAVAGQGDYTQESYEAYANAVERAREVYGHVAATQAEADAAKAAIDSAADGLELRTPVMTQGAETQINLFVNKTKTLSVADYIDGNNLSKLTYEVTTESTGITLSEVESGEFTVTAGDVAVDSARVTITVKYDGEVIEGCTVTLTVSVTSQAAPTFKEQTVTVTKDLYTETEKQGLTLDLAANVNNPAELPLEFTVQVGDGESVSAEDGTYTYAYGEYTEETTTVNIKVTVSYTANEAPATSEYAYVLILTDTTAYRIANGGFDNGLEGWTGTSGTIGTADRYFATETFEGYPMNNDNGYYAGIDNGTETVTSSTFTVGGTGWITFKLGSMRPYDNGGLRNVYLEVVDVDTDTAVARVRNVLFSDPEAALKLNDYKLDLSSLKGKQVYLRAVDNEDGGDFRGIYLDKIVSYYTEEPTGDYTDLTGTRYLDGTLSLDLNGSASGAVAPVILSDGVIATPSYASVNIYADETGTPVDGLTVDGLNVTAKKSGAYRLVYNEGTVSEFTVNVTVTNSTELPAFVDKTAEINVNESIPSIPLELKSTDERFNYSLTVDKGEVDENGNYTYNDADTSQSGVIEVTVTVKISDTKYSDEAYGDKSYKIIITVKGANISLNETKESTETYDIYDKTETEQESRTIDFAEYLIIPDGAAVTYTGTLTVDDGVATEITFTGSEYTLNYADYALGETAKAFKFAVTVSAGGTPVTINLTLNVKDTRVYRIANGGFDNGLEGWTLGNPDLGGVNNTETYWADGIPFNNDGNFFNAYYFDGEARESAMGTLTSSPFTIGGSGWITYKLGGAKNADKVYLDVIEKDTGVILARYYNDAFSDDGESTEVRGCTLVAYKADLSEHKGKTVYIRLSDNAVNDYGLFFADSFVTYYQEEPTTGNIATSVAHPDTIYQLYNGGFETGDLKGWTLNGDIGYVSESDTYFSGSYDKDGTYLFSGVEDTHGSYEANTGTLTSSYFTVGGSGWITFKLGGGGNAECYISVIDESGNELLRFRQQNIQDGKLILHKANLSSLMGKTVAIRIVDNASSGWGCLAVDSFVTYYESDSGLPEDAVEAPDLLASASSSDREEGATD